MAVFKRKIGTFPFSDRDTKDFDLKSVGILRRIWLAFAGTVTVAGGTTNGTLVEDGLVNVLARKLQLLADGSAIVEVSGRILYWLRALVAGVQPTLVNPGVAVGAHPVRASLVLDLQAILSGALFSGRINAGQMRDLVLRVETGLVDGELITGGDRAESMAGTLEVMAEYSNRASDWVGGHRRISRHSYVNAGATTEGRINLPSGIIVPGILLLAVDNGVRANTIVNRVSVKVGEDDIRRDVSWSALQDDNLDEFGLTPVAGAPPYAGVAYMNMDRDHDGDPAKVLDLRAAVADAGRVVLDVGAPTGVSNVEVVPVALSTRPRP